MERVELRWMGWGWVPWVAVGVEWGCFPVGFSCNNRPTKVANTEFPAGRGPLELAMVVVGKHFTCLHILV